MLQTLFLIPQLAAIAAAAVDPEAASCQRKFDEIKLDRAKPGAIYQFTPREVTAWARQEIPKQIPDGIRDPAVQTAGPNQATGSAIVDFLKMRHAKGAKPNWLLEKLIAGERPLKVGVEIKSSGGYATVYLRSVQISGISASGTVLEYMVKTFFRPLYPEASINEPFELGHNVERIEIRPEGARVYIKGTPAGPAPPPATPKKK